MMGWRSRKSNDRSIILMMKILIMMKTNDDSNDEDSNDEDTNDEGY